MITRLLSDVFNGVGTALTDFVEWRYAMPTLILGAVATVTVYVLRVKEN
jgi:hypothetical protein